MNIDPKTINMKKSLIYLLVLFLTGCTSTQFYQLYKTDSKDLKKTESVLISENDDIDIIYNFWSQNGNGDFLIVNKTDSSIYIDLGFDNFNFSSFNSFCNYV